MFLLSHRHPRFVLLLAALHITILLLLLAHSPFTLYQSSSASRRPLINPSIVHQALSARVRRAERAYQKSLRTRDVLIAKVGPAPRDVSLFPPDKEPWPPYTVCEGLLPPAFFCPHELERVGDLGDGGKWFCGLSRLQEKEDCIVYSIGHPASASFEAELLARTRHCQLFLFDHTTSSLPSALSSPTSLPSALGEFYASLDASRAHLKPYRIANFDAHAMGDSPKTYTLESLMRKNGHTHIDVLKIDLEGWEFDALATFLVPSPDFTSERPRVPPVSQMLLELHLWNREFPYLLSWWSVLERAGFRAVAREPNLVYQNYNRLQGAELAEYTFLNVAAPNIFISDEVPTSYPSSLSTPSSLDPPLPAVASTHESDEQSD
ncbi:methyltransferase domain-containing protein [Lactifluus volemus]|nr:methyltransferase domain-containing protein [Lactifluus volemus]